MHYQPKLFQARLHCYCGVAVIVGGGYGDVELLLRNLLSDDDVVFQ